MDTSGSFVNVDNHQIANPGTDSGARSGAGYDTFIVMDMLPRHRPAMACAPGKS